MDRDLLKHYLDQRLSLPQIGALMNRHPSTVGYWVKKHGLVANGKERYSPRGGLNREQLEPLVDSGATLAQIAEALDRSERTVRYWLAKYGLRTKARRGPNPMVSHEVVQKAIEEGRRTVAGVCSHHGPGVFVIEGSGRSRCRRCRMERVSDRRRQVKAILIEEAGGRCIRCGYDRFIGALQFHHRDRKKKSFAISRKGHTIGIDRLREEARKCDLLCANCHAEIEHGGDDLTLK
jgi:Homeodomain-like domain